MTTTKTRRLLRQLTPLLLALAVSACADDADTTTTPAPEADAAAGCTSDLSCGDGNVCVNETCRPGECNIDRTCADGFTCDRRSYTCASEAPESCATHEACVGNGYCIGGECRDEQCADDTHCADGESCNADYRCVTDVSCIDGDADGYGTGCDLGADCDDGDADINPGVTEDSTHNCDDGTDHNCDGRDAVCGSVDADADGFNADIDCDDGDADVNPDAEEVPYNGTDDDCDERTRDADLDGDGYDSVDAMGGGDDCDDHAAHIHPDATDIPGNGVDEDCSGADAVAEAVDSDGDGVTALDGDCDDTNAAVYPGAVEVPYNGLDDDCNLATRDNDLDEDGVDHPADCDDTNAGMRPGQAEIYYNGIDDDCDAATADDDADADGFAAVAAGGDDCNDEAATINPDVDEVPYNGFDDDCDAATLDDDLDGDTFGHDVDCDDNNPDVNPDVIESADTNCSDGIDHDCRGGDVECDAGAVDSDGDGVPDDQDCEPDNADIPGAEEIPNNGLDDDCNPATPDVVAVCVDDAFEVAADNDTAETASAVEDGDRIGVQYGELVTCNADDDWYRINLNQGDGLEIDVMFDNSGESDIDVVLMKFGADGALVPVDSSTSFNAHETVYERRAPADGVYVVRIYDFNEARTPYAMTVNVFESCTDDDTMSGEHNDEQGSGGVFPQLAERRQICDYDDDWYTFTLAAPQRVRLDLLFSHDVGDLDMRLHVAGDDGALGWSVSFDDNELIEMDLAAGDYEVRVYGARGAQGSYQLFRTSGVIDTAVEFWGVGEDIPDYADGVAGVAEVDLLLDAPVGAVIRNLRILDLDINHSYLRDLRVTALWDGQEIVVLWDREGAADGTDGGLDDDFLIGTGGDINFDNRDYPQFAGLPAFGIFTLRVEDLAIGDVGEIADIDVEVEYLIP